MKKLASICIVCLLFSLAFYPAVYGNEEKAKIVIQQYKLNGIERVEKEISTEKADELLGELEKLEKAIKNNEMEKAAKLIHKLEKEGIDEIYFVHKLMNGINVSWNLSNLLCFTFGFGEGAFLYMPENLLIIAALLGIIKFESLWDLLAFIALVYLVAVISHLIPFRVALPFTFFAVVSGELVTVGLNGMIGFHPVDNLTAFGAIIGFIGLIINIIIPKEEAPISYFFCTGYSLLVLAPYLESS
jgi:hypothetical protein